MIETITVQTQQDIHICNWCKKQVNQSEAAWNAWLEQDDDLDLHDSCLEDIARKAVNTVVIDA